MMSVSLMLRNLRMYSMGLLRAKIAVSAARSAHLTLARRRGGAFIKWRSWGKPSIVMSGACVRL